jgi:hypothetical protein
VTSENEQRWPQICGLFEKARSLDHDEYFNVGRLAIHLRQAFAEACGCPDDYVAHYKYVHGFIPLNDTSEKVKSGWDSISKNEGIWSFGLGIKLEIALNAFPKSVFVYPFNIRQAEGRLSVESTIFSGVEHIRFSTYKSDLDALAERMFESLSTTLKSWSKGGGGSTALGFSLPTHTEDN